jgi:TATA-box binding protein (TBP) (component of TFIID and TFIIIB)
MQQLTRMPEADSIEADKAEVKIVNIIAKTQINKPFSLSHLTSKFPFDDNPALSRIAIPYKHVHFSIFRTGSVIVRSAKSIEELEEAFNWLRSILYFSYNLRLADSYDILNIVAVTRYSAVPLRLSELAYKLPRCSYDPVPQLINGSERLINIVVHYFNANRKLKPRKTALLFRTGYVTLTGFNAFNDLEKCSAELQSMIAEIVLKHPDVLEGIENDRSTLHTEKGRVMARV